MNNQLQLSQVFQQISCTIYDHNDYKVSRICVDKDCKESKLVCDLCDIAHKTHRGSLLTIAEVQKSFIELQNSNQADQNYKRLYKMVEDFERISMIKLKQLVSDLKQFLAVTNQLENSFLKNKIRSYSELQNQITQLLNYVELQNGEIKFKILKPSDLHPKIHDRLSKYLQEINNYWKKNTGYCEQQGSTQQDQPLQEKLQQNPQQQQIHQQPPHKQQGSTQQEQSLQEKLQQNPQQQQIHQQSLPKLQEQNQETEKGSLQNDLDNQKQIGKIRFLQQEQLTNAKFSLQNQISAFQFTPEFCSQQIKCLTPKCVQKIADNMSNDVACLNKPVSPYEKQSFVFRINRLKGFIGIGISIFWSVEANNFMFGQLDEVVHGVFMVLNNGLVYNNNYPKYNMITGQIEFLQGQKYRLTYDPLNKEGKQFTIQSLSQNSAPFTMPMHIYEALDYHVFIYMGQRDGEVELLNEI